MSTPEIGQDDEAAQTCGSGDTMTGYLTTAQVAAKLGISTRRVVALIKAGRLEAEMFSGSWAIRHDAVSAVRDRMPGRPWHKNRGDK